MIFTNPRTLPLLITYGVLKFLCYVQSLQFHIKQVTGANIEYADEQTEGEARLDGERGEEKFAGKRGSLFIRAPKALHIDWT